MVGRGVGSVGRGRVGRVGGVGGSVANGKRWVNAGPVSTREPTEAGANRQTEAERREGGSGSEGGSRTPKAGWRGVRGEPAESRCGKTQAAARLRFAPAYN